MLYYISYITESWQRFLKRNQISYGPHQEQIFDGLVELASSRSLTKRSTTILFIVSPCAL